MSHVVILSSPIRPTWLIRVRQRNSEARFSHLRGGTTSDALTSHGTVDAARQRVGMDSKETDRLAEQNRGQPITADTCESVSSQVGSKRGPLQLVSQT